MAPSTTIRKPKNAFSPPRPGKSKVTKSTKEKGAAITKSAAARRSLGATGNSKVRKQLQQGNQRAGQKTKPQKTKRRGAAGTMRAILGESDADSDSNPEEEDNDGDGAGSDENMDTRVEEDESLGHEDDHDNDDDTNAQGEEDGEEEEEEEEASLFHDRDLNLSSPEPDFILAEVTTNGTGGNPTSSTSPSIPLPLIHRIMHAHFLKPDHTSLSADARHLMGKYADIFVKEAIRRCVDDKRERAAARGSGDGGVVGDTGWLEVEDLERVGVQLCLDF
ncbi:hypothetical protein AYO21_05053 [Fonsecaea monophora]|uniref:Uncharacterized protein n=1 Tax=Fonsecaea monophora TaxID=254056 RepID=A0A177F959_9EURO|nr:hypothetical protein AYO21_05053 [Fonsecaea monophora]KAH0837565.1 hypothetical protein FOPE_05168 [Fonsecaea pedrosoi]OAG40755.1 hypothetical protein AYO21_05053 [Fonsecaea monophora]